MQIVLVRHRDCSVETGMYGIKLNNEVYHLLQRGGETLCGLRVSRANSDRSQRADELNPEGVCKHCRRISENTWQNKIGVATEDHPYK